MVKKFKLKNAFALEYVIMLMVFAVAVSLVLITAASLSVTAYNGYESYVSQKRYLDQVAYDFINGDNQFLTEESSYGITFEADESVLTAKSGDTVLLTVIVQEKNGDRALIKYVYGAV